MKKTILLTLLIISSGHIVHAQCKPFNPITYDKQGNVNNMNEQQERDLFIKKPYCRDEKIKELNALLAEHGRSDRVTVSNFDAYYFDTCQTVSADYFDYPILYDGEDQYGNICIAAKPRDPYKGELIHVLVLNQVKKPVGSKACGNTGKNPRTTKTLLGVQTPSSLNSQTPESKLERIETKSKIQSKNEAGDVLSRVVTNATKSKQSKATKDLEELPRVATRTSAKNDKVSTDYTVSNSSKSQKIETYSDVDIEPIEKEVTQKVIVRVKPVYEYVYDEPIITPQNESTPCRVSSRCKSRVRTVSISNGQSVCVSDKCGRKTEVIVN
jgi:hypothetical protein